MRLNDLDDSLPEWPSMEESSDGYIVHGKHVPYERYMRAKWALFTPMPFLWLFVGYMLAFHVRQFPTGLLLFCVTIMFVYIAALAAPSVNWLAKAFFQTETHVLFTPTSIALGERVFSLERSVSVQFRVGGSPLKERRHRKLYEKMQQKGLSENAAHELRFHNVDMIYGARVVRITSIDNPEKAEQFVIALQVALLMAAQSRHMVSNSKTLKFTEWPSLPE